MIKHDPRLLKDERCLVFLSRIEESMRMMIYEAWEYGYKEGFECAARQIDNSINNEFQNLMTNIDKPKNNRN